MFPDFQVWRWYTNETTRLQPELVFLRKRFLIGNQHLGKYSHPLLFNLFRFFAWISPKVILLIHFKNLFVRELFKLILRLISGDDCMSAWCCSCEAKHRCVVDMCPHRVRVSVCALVSSYVTSKRMEKC